MRLATSLPLVALVLNFAAFAPQARSAPPEVVAQTPPMAGMLELFCGKG